MARPKRRAPVVDLNAAGEDADGFTASERAEADRLIEEGLQRWWAEYYVCLRRRCHCDEPGDGSRCDPPCPLVRAGVDCRVRYRASARGTKTYARRGGPRPVDPSMQSGS